MLAQKPGAANGEFALAAPAVKRRRARQGASKRPPKAAAKRRARRAKSDCRDSSTTSGEFVRFTNTRSPTR